MAQSGWAVRCGPQHIVLRGCRGGCKGNYICERIPLSIHHFDVCSYICIVVVYRTLDMNPNKGSGLLEQNVMLVSTYRFTVRILYATLIVPNFIVLKTLHPRFDVVCGSR